LSIRNVFAETEVEAQQQQEQVQQQAEKEQPIRTRQELVMRAVFLKKGEYGLSNSLVLPSLDVCLIGEHDTVLVPGPNVLAILGVGNKDIKCSKCGYVLARKIKKPQIQNISIRCSACNTLNKL
jgi:hypothetical protein